MNNRDRATLRRQLIALRERALDMEIGGWASAASLRESAGKLAGIAAAVDVLVLSLSGLCWRSGPRGWFDSETHKLAASVVAVAERRRDDFRAAAEAREAKEAKMERQKGRIEYLTERAERLK